MADVDDTNRVFRNPNVDEQEDPHKYIQAMDSIRKMPLMAKQKKCSIDDLHLSPGASAIDVGCGTGEEVVTMARLVGERGRCVGIDPSQTMLEEARRRAKDTKLPIEFQKGDIYDLQFDDDTFDASRAERVFEHLEYPQKALSEMIRVTKRGGRIVAISPDVDCHAFDFPDRTLARKLVHYLCDERVNGWAGRQLYIMFVNAGLSEVSCQVFTHAVLDVSAVCNILEKAAGNAWKFSAISSGELRQIQTILSEMRNQKAGFYASPHFLVAGTKN
jgi:ubiquinone/menaquinone biosynthesis C-methylase UbiE